MTTIDRHHLVQSGLETLHQPTEQIFDSYPALYGNQHVLVIGAGDYRAASAIAIEKFNMLLLGDPESLVDVDLAKDLESARFLTLYPEGEELGINNMLGVVRVTDFNPVSGKLRSFREASEVTGDSYENIFAHFVEQTGQSDPTKVFDINTYGMSESVWQKSGEDRDSFQNTKWNLMFAMTHEGIRRHNETGATHGIAYFNALSWEYFLNKGYDWQQLNGYNPVKDKIIGDDGQIIEGQTLVPTVLSIAEHTDRMRAAVTQHLGELAIGIFGSELPKSA